MKLTYQVEEFKERLEKALEWYEKQREKNIEAEKQEREKINKKFEEDKAKVEKAIQELEEEYKQKVAEIPDVYTETFWGKKTLQPKEDIRLLGLHLLWEVVERSHVVRVEIRDMYEGLSFHDYKRVFKISGIRFLHPGGVNSWDRLELYLKKPKIERFDCFDTQISQIKNKLFLLKGAQQSVELEHTDPVLGYLRYVEEK